MLNKCLDVRLKRQQQRLDKRWHSFSYRKIILKKIKSVQSPITLSNSYSLIETLIYCLPGVHNNVFYLISDNYKSNNLLFTIYVKSQCHVNVNIIHRNIWNPQNWFKADAFLFQPIYDFFFCAALKNNFL